MKSKKMLKSNKIKSGRIRHSAGRIGILCHPQGVRGIISAPRATLFRAFTIIEIIVVIVIIAIAAAIIIPYAIETTTSQARSAARMIMSDLTYAQNEAIVTQTPITVTFDISGNSYTISNESGPLIHPITKKAYVVDLDTISGFENVVLSSASFGGPSMQ